MSTVALGCAKPPVYEADHSPPSSAKVNVCGCPDVACSVILNYLQGQVYLYFSLLALCSMTHIQRVGTDCALPVKASHLLY